MSLLKFSKISIIESLGSSDKKTGKLLFDDLEVLEIFHEKGISIEYVPVSNSQELISHIQALTIGAKEHGVYPVLQIEAHGSNDKQSLILSSKEAIAWRALEPHLRELNIASECNLLIVMATCFGLYASSAISILDRAPFWGLIGPEELVFPDQILQSLTKFYTAIYSAGSAQALLESLKPAANEAGLQFITSEWFFIKSYKYYVQEYCKSPSFRTRIERIRSKLQKQAPIDFPIDEHIQSHFELNGKEKFEAMLKYFFMVDLFHKNMDKISVKYEQVNL